MKTNKTEQNKTKKSHILEGDMSILHFGGCCLYKTFTCVPSHFLHLAAWLLRQSGALQLATLVEEPLRRQCN